jgi:hypothetical protein
MKVVGGPSDGIDVWIPKDKQHITLLDPVYRHALTLASYDYNNHSDALRPDNSVASYTTYTVRMIRSNRPPKPSPDNIIDPQFDELRFLAPQDWSDFKAIQFQFTK